MPDDKRFLNRRNLVQGSQDNLTDALSVYVSIMWKTKFPDFKCIHMHFTGVHITTSQYIFDYHANAHIA